MSNSHKSTSYIFIAILAALLLGVGLRQFNFEETPAILSFLFQICDWVAQLFLRALKLIMVPLVLCSIVASLATLSPNQSIGKLGAKTISYYLASSLVAVIIGLIVVNLIQPGLSDGQPNQEIRSLFMSGEQASSEKLTSKVAVASQREAGDFLDILYKVVPDNLFATFGDNGALLGVISFAIAMGIALRTLPQQSSQPMTQFMISGQEVMITITNWIMLAAPFGVFALIFPTVYNTGLVLFVQLGKYFTTVVLALGIHLLIAIPLILHYLGKVSPLAFFKAMRPALLTAFSTASSASTLPITLNCVEKRVGVSKETSSFTLPLGATVNMDGTALYECVAVIFVAQVMGVELSWLAQAGIVITALLTSIGVAGIPSASLVAILLILKTSNIPNAELAIIALLSVDRLLDMSRTMINIASDACAATVIAKSQGETLKV